MNSNYKGLVRTMTIRLQKTNGMSSRQVKNSNPKWLGRTISIRLEETNRTSNCILLIHHMIHEHIMRIKYDVNYPGVSNQQHNPEMP